jgi:hypothetical protein
MSSVIPTELSLPLMVYYAAVLSSLLIIMLCCVCSSNNFNLVIILNVVSLRLLVPLLDTNLMAFRGKLAPLN